MSGIIRIIRPGLDIDAIRLINAMTVKPDGRRAQTISRAIRQLKQFGIWNTKDHIFVPACHASTERLLNWKTPGSNGMTETNSPSFAVDRGITGNGSSSYCTFPNVYTKFAQNDASYTVISLSSLAAAGNTLFGVAQSGTVGQGYLIPRKTGDVFESDINANPGTSTHINGANATTYGCFHTQRTGSTANEQFLNAASLGTGSNTSTAVPNIATSILAHNNAGVRILFLAAQFPIASLGSSLTSGQILAEYMVWKQYLQALGVNI